MSHDAHHSDPPETSNPLIWTVGLIVAIAGLSFYFALNYDHGHVKGAGHGHIPAPASAGPVEPDHAALIANKGDDVLDAGASLFAKNCASCHGPKGDSNPTGMNPPPRNFAKEAFRNPNGGGPYGLYTVLSKGFNGMPAFPALTPEDRYALVHFVRERLVQPVNPDHYVADDAPDLKAKIPAPGGAGGPTVAPKDVKSPDQVYPLMAGIARANEAEARAFADWIARSVDGSEGVAGEILVDLSRKAGAAYLKHLAAAAHDGDAAAVKALLLAPPMGVHLPQAALMTADDLKLLTAQLRKAKPVASDGGN